MTTPIKANPELRHVLAHIMSAIEELANGRPLSAIHEIQGVESLVLFFGDDEMEGYLSGMHEEEKTDADAKA